MSRLLLTLSPTLTLSEEQFAQLCQYNPDLRLERTSAGDLVVMSPTGSETGAYNASINAQLWLWNQQTKEGVVFDSSPGFRLPNGAVRSPDAAWIQRDRWEALSEGDRQEFAPICPDVVIELGACHLYALTLNPSPNLGRGTLSGFSPLLPILEKLILSLSKGGWGMRAIQGFANVTCSH